MDRAAIVIASLAMGRQPARELRRVCQGLLKRGFVRYDGQSYALTEAGQALIS